MEAPLGGHLQKRLPRETGKFAPLGDTKCFFNQPTCQSIGNRPIGQPRQSRGGRTERIDSRQHPIVQPLPIGLQVGCFGFNHQFGYIHTGRTLQSAHVAMDTQFGYLSEGIIKDRAEWKRTGQNTSGQIGFGSR